MKFSIQDICRITHGTSEASGDVTRLIFDSRTVTISDGVMFCALMTSAADGHRFIPQAYVNGIRMFLVEQIPSGSFPDAKFVVVDSVQDALEQLAVAARNRLNSKKVVGITGSRGKTVVKELIYTALRDAGANVWRSPRSWNSRIGVPVSLVNAPDDADIYLFEAGIDTRGTMMPLADMIRPEIGILTSMTDAHQAGFVSMQDKIEEKIKLFADCKIIIADNSSQQVKQIIKRRFPDTKLIFTEDETPEKQNLALASAAVKVLGFQPTYINQNNQPDNRIDVFQGVNNCLILHDRFTPDAQSIEATLDFMHRRSVSDRSNTLITTPHFANDPANTELFSRFGISRVIAAENSFFDYYDSADFHDETIMIAGGPSSLFDEIKNAIEQPRHDTVFEINLNSLIHNLNYYRSLLAAETGIVGMVKAQAYGTGALEVAKTLQAQGAAYLAVAVIDEGVALRRGGITMPIMVLNPVTSNYGAMFRNNLEPTIFSLDELRQLADKARYYGVKEFKAHIKLDTGMHRVGFTPTEIKSLINELQKHPEIKIASIFSHLATADCPDQDEYTEAQLNTFREQSQLLIDAIPYSVKRHILNTAGIQTHPEHQYDMVRLGIGLYGVSPVEIESGKLEPVATLKSRIISIKHWPAGTTIGYGRRGLLNRDSVIATVAIGYADGINRHLGRGRASFIVNGKACPTVGNICMDQLMIDVTDVPNVMVGNDVEIYGTNQPVEHLAELLDTIPYELIATVSPRVSRIYYND